ncbi:MFS transporter [Amycolatopsis sp. NPDC088138]|uniref:MFS transporter n=1 Tax=Amycolatopsis sp. NPDC088138 TaxID=3363938 RepID=UPI00381BC3CA
MSESRIAWRGLPPLAVPAYRKLWIVSMLSHFGTWMHNTAAAAQLAHSSPAPLTNALLLAAATLPAVLLSFPAGLLADRIGRGTVLFWANATGAAVAAVFAILNLCDGLGPAAILGLTFALNAGWAAGYPAWNAEVSSVLPADLVKDGAALNSLSFNLARTLGPAAGGFAFGAVGGFPVYLANALSFAGFMLCFRKTRRMAASAARGSWRDSLRETSAFVRDSPRFRALLVRAVMFFSLAQSMSALVPVYVLTVRHRSAADLGFVLAAFGAGAVCSAVSYPNLRRRVPERVLRCACAVLAALALAALPLLGSVSALFAVGVVFGAAQASMVTVNNGFLQTTVALSLRSRAVALYIVVLYGAQTIGAVVAGALSAWWGVGPAAWAIAVLLAACALPGRVRQRRSGS